MPVHALPEEAFNQEIKELYVEKDHDIEAAFAERKKIRDQQNRTAPDKPMRIGCWRARPRRATYARRED